MNLCFSDIRGPRVFAVALLMAVARSSRLLGVRGRLISRSLNFAVCHQFRWMFLVAFCCDTQEAIGRDSGSDVRERSYLRSAPPPKGDGRLGGGMGGGGAKGEGCNEDAFFLSSGLRKGQSC